MEVRMEAMTNNIAMLVSAKFDFLPDGTLGVSFLKEIRKIFD